MQPGTLSACIEVLFKDEARTPEDRIRRAAEAGFAAVEMWHWWNKDLPAIRASLDDTGLAMTSMIVEPQLPLVGDLPQAAVADAVRQSAAAARALGTGRLIVVSGDAVAGRERAPQQAALIANLTEAARVAAEEGVVLLLEPLNSRVDHIGQYLDTTAEGLAVVKAVNSPSLMLLYDIYHSAVMDEDTPEVLAGSVRRVGHVHVADAPGRHEPGSGTVDLAARTRWLLEQGYAGAIGLEYWPQTSTRDSLIRVASALPSS